MLRKIILATHGHFCEAIKESCELIMGKQENLETLAVVAGMGSDDMYHFFSSQIKDSLDKDGELPLIFVDVYGGSPYNQAIRTLRNYDVSIITGLNLPMLLEVLVMRNELSYKELTQLAEDMGQKGIKILTKSNFMNNNI